MLEFEDHGIRGGVWSGRIIGKERPHAVCGTCRGEDVGQAVLEDDPEGGWIMRLEVPPSILSDGVSSLVLVAALPNDGQPLVHLGALHLAAGKILNPDVEAEIAALRSELELLKREFRRMGRRG